MSSKLIKKLEALQELEEYRCKQEGTTTQYAAGYIHGLGEAIGIAEKHEAQQMKEPFYQLDEEQENLLNELQIVSREIKCLDLDEVLDKCYHKRLVNEQLAILWESLDVIPKNQVFNAFTTWAIKQDNLEEEK